MTGASTPFFLTPRPERARMPTPIRKTTPGESLIHNHGTVAGGETIRVSPDFAEYLVDTGHYEYADDETDADADDDMAAQIESGECPWCPQDDRYEGDHVGQHASSAHSDAWDQYTQE